MATQAKQILPRTVTPFPPGPQVKGLLGGTRSFRDNRLGFMMNNARTFGDLWYVRMGLNNHVFALNHPDLIHKVLVSDADKFVKAPRFKQSSLKLLGNGILTSEGDEHKRNRKLVQPAFHHTRIASYADTMVTYSAQTAANWHDGQTLDMHQAMITLTRNIVAKTLFNTDVSDQGDQIGEAISVALETNTRRVGRLFNLPDWVPTAENAARRKVWKIMNDMLDRVIDEHRTGGDQGDLLSMLLLSVDEDDGSGMSNQQARDEAMTLFIAGHETTANALAWTWYLLALHPDADAKLGAELASVLGARAPTMADLPQLPYTEQVIKESMRLYPPAWMVNIRQAQQDVSIGEYVIPKGGLTLISPYVMHHDPRYFAQPDAFQPERWTPEFEKALPRFAYFPFGGGPRVCIGNSFAMMEARLSLATLAQNWQAALLPDQLAIEPEPLVTLRPKGGIQMKLTARP